MASDRLREVLYGGMTDMKGRAYRRYARPKSYLPIPEFGDSRTSKVYIVQRRFRLLI
jgi:hypothetical protein